MTIPGEQVGGKAWQVRRRATAELTARHLELLALEFIPEHPAEAAELRARALELAADIVRTFHLMPPASPASRTSRIRDAEADP